MISPAERPEPADDVTRRQTGVRRVLLVVLGLNMLVLAIKNVVAIRTGAVAVLGATLESGLDVLGSMMGLLLVSVAAREPDEDHPYGHGKFETLGTLGIVGFLSISCYELLRESVVALIRDEAPRATSLLDVAVLGFTLLVNAYVVWYERREGRRLSSAFLVADAAHTRGDFLVTALAMLSLMLSGAGIERIDGALGIAVALVIAWSGYQILRQSVPVLVDARALDAAALTAVVRRVPQVREVRSVRSRSTATGQLFADVTIAVDGSLTVERAHDLADEVERAIALEYGAAEVTVHIEPS